MYAFACSGSLTGRKELYRRKMWVSFPLALGYSTYITCRPRGDSSLTDTRKLSLIHKNYRIKLQIVILTSRIASREHCVTSGVLNFRH